MRDNDMQQEVKRFVAPSMSRALELVRDEMGPEAIILSSKTVDGGVEIVTSVERDLGTRGVDERRQFGRNFDAELDQVMESDTAWRSQAGIQQAADSYQGRPEDNDPRSSSKKSSKTDLSVAIERAREKMYEATREKREPKAPAVRNQKSQSSAPELSARAHVPALSVNNANEDTHLGELRSEIADLRMLLEQQMWSSSSQTSSQGSLPAAASSKESDSRLVQHLRRLGLEENLVKRLSDEAPVGRCLSDTWKLCLANLSRKIPIQKDMGLEVGGVFSFVGPTGVGKTTTLAKMAARYAMKHGPGNVALISMDIHRVGALDQLKALGKILDVPVRSVDASNSLFGVLNALKQFKLVLIDTAGFRHGDPLLKAQLAQLDEQNAVKRILVLSSSSQYQTLKASIHAFSSSKNIDACVLTKLDEASSLGEAISAVVEHQLPLAYTTDGQNIPKDISEARSANIIAQAVAISREQDANQRAFGD
ncbi:MAG: flagellar biosynthesis protein FlhF [Flavobacteriales bacterium]|jgi:flagellar biosynthesis protein FlhF